MAWAYRASSYANNGAGVTIANGATATVTLGAALTAADFIALGIMGLETTGGDPAPTFTVSDSVNGSSGWTQTQGGTVTWIVGSNNVRTSLWVFPNSGAGTPVVTVTIGGVAAHTYNVGLQVMAFSGIDVSASPKDTGAVASGTGSISSGAVSPATGAANELMIGCYLDAGENTTLTVGNIAGSAATLAGKHDADGGKWQGLFEYGDSSSSGGTPTATVNTTGTPAWGMLAAVYKITGGGAAAPIGKSRRVLQAVNRAGTY